LWRRAPYTRGFLEENVPQKYKAVVVPYGWAGP
jgi:hypothetical protein